MTTPGPSPRRTALIVAVLLVIPTSASANAGTPLMWTTALHLLFGNALLGVGEGLLIARWQKVAKWRTVALMVLANYVSAWVGGYWGLHALFRLPDITVETIRFWLAMFLLAAFTVTLLLEFPFVWLALPKDAERLKRSVRVTLGVHTMSYAILVGWYSLASGVSVAELTPVDGAQLRPPEELALFYVGPDGKTVWRGALAGGGLRVIAKKGEWSNIDRLYVASGESGGFDLMELPDRAKRKLPPSGELVLRDFAEHALPEQAQRGSGDVSTTWFNFGRIGSLVDEPAWSFRTGFWSMEGIRATENTTGEARHFRMEVPFAWWHARNATQVDDHLLLVQLGRDQICLLDPVSNQIALVARGWGPVVVVPKMGPVGH